MTSLAVPPTHGRTPACGLVVVACLDARVDVPRVLGLGQGEAHVIRNAGGVVTDDDIRSLALSQRRLGAREVVVVHHTDCDLLPVADDQPGSAGVDVDREVRDSVTRIQTSPYVPHTDQVRGFVLDVATGRLREVA